MPTSADRNLLFGILALQLDFISREQLVAGMNAWVLAKNRSLAEVLESQQALAPARKQLLEPLVDEHIRQHNGDPRQSLAAAGSTADVHADLSRIADPQLAASIPHLSRTTTLGYSPPSTKPDFFATVTTSSASPSGTRFRVLRPHAQGGLGKVSVAQDEELHREVALKEIQPQYADDPAARARFVLEAEVTGGLEHPSIVPVYGLGCYPDGRPYYAMRFIRGDSLKEVVDRFHQIPDSAQNSGRRAIEMRQLLGRFIDVCQAIEYAHSRGILHRDIKPGNIMLGAYGETLVVDWGLAKAKGTPDVPVSLGSERALRPMSGSSVEPTQMGAMVGTLHFMSPEQADGRLDLMGPAADIYSLGATLYYLLTGRPSIQATTIDEILKEIRSGSFPPPSAILRGVPKGLEAICLKAMAREPQKRYASAKELADDIERWLADEPVSVHQESNFDKLARWARRHRSWVQAVSASTLAIIGVLVIAVFLINGQRQEADTQRKNAEALAQKNGELATREAELRKSAEWTAANRSFEQSLLRCQQIDASAGLLSLANSLEEAHRIEADDLEHSIRAQLGQWSGSVHALDTILPQERGVISMALSSDGQLLCVGMSDQAVLINADTGQPILQPLKHDGAVKAAIFTSDGKTLLTGSEDKSVRFWDVATANQIGESLVHDAEIAAMALSADEKFLAVGNGNFVEVWEVETRQKTNIKVEHPASVSTVAFSPTEPLLLSADWGVQSPVQLWNVKTNAAVGSSWPQTGTVMSIGLSPNGKLAAVGSLHSEVRIWDVAAGQPIGLPLPHQGLVTCATFSADSRQLLTGSGDQSARLWDVATHRLVGPPLRHPHLINAAVLDQKRGTIWTAGADGVRRWRMANGRSVLLPFKGIANQVAASFNSDGTAIRVFSAGLIINELDLPGIMRRWNVPGGSPLGTAQQDQRWKTLATFSPTGERFATLMDDETVQVWNVADGAPVGPPIKVTGTVKTLAFNHDDSVLLIGMVEGQCQCWRVSNGEPAHAAIQFSERVSAAVFFPDNEHYLVGCWDSTVNLCRGSEQISKINAGYLVSALDIDSTGGKLLIGTGEGSLRLWNAKTFEQTGQVMKHSSRVLAAKFSSDGRSIVASYFDGSTRLWDARTCTEIGSPLAHTKAIAALAVSRDGKYAATASDDGTARLWNITPATGTLVEVKRRCETQTSLRLAKDGSLEVIPAAEWLQMKADLDGK